MTEHLSRHVACSSILGYGIGIGDLEEESLLASVGPSKRGDPHSRQGSAEIRARLTWTGESPNLHVEQGDESARRGWNVPILRELHGRGGDAEKAGVDGKALQIFIDKVGREQGLKWR